MRKAELGAVDGELVGRGVDVEDADGTARGGDEARTAYKLGKI